MIWLQYDQWRVDIMIESCRTMSMCVYLMMKMHFDGIIMIDYLKVNHFHFVFTINKNSPQKIQKHEKRKLKKKVNESVNIRATKINENKTTDSNDVNEKRQI